jgi:hypothetical protein
MRQVVKRGQATSLSLDALVFFKRQGSRLTLVLLFFKNKCSFPISPIFNQACHNRIITRVFYCFV